MITHEESIADFLIENNKDSFKEYDKARVMTIVRDVLDAMRELRVLKLEEMRNKRILIEVQGLHVECFVHDVKFTEDGVQFNVKPIAGNKTIWVKRFVKIL